MLRQDVHETKLFLKLFTAAAQRWHLDGWVVFYFRCRTLRGGEEGRGGAWEGRNIHELLLWGQSQGCVTEKGDRCSWKMFDATQPCLFNRLARSSFSGLISTRSLWPPRQTEPADNERHIRGDNVQTRRMAGDACRDDSLMRTRSSVLILCVTIWYLLGHRLRSQKWALPVSFLAFPSPFSGCGTPNSHENFLVRPPRCAQTSYSFTRAHTRPHEGRSKINRDALFCRAAGWNNIPLNNPNSARLNVPWGEYRSHLNWATQNKHRKKVSHVGKMWVKRLLSRKKKKKAEEAFGKT